MPAYHITPNDVLFFRDARPFQTGGGHGARWPEPGIIFSALHAALHRAWPDTQTEWEHLHRHGASGKYDNARRDKRFGSLQTCGPYPSYAGRWYFPAPQDAVVDESRKIAVMRPLRESPGKSNLPQPLQYSLAHTAQPSKTDPTPGWWSKSDIENYLAGGDTLSDAHQSARFFSSEWTTGIGIDAETQTQNGEQLYSAEYLRLTPGIAMGITAAMPLKNGDGDGMTRLFEKDGLIVVGGQQRVCRVIRTEQAYLDALLPTGRPVSGNRLKWLLLSPAVFPKIGEHPGGWLPSWVDHITGEVKLTDGPGKNKAGRKKLATGSALNVKLVTARIPKPLVISGWSERLHLRPVEQDPNAKPDHGPTRTDLAVPAGAVYYFEGPDAARLADQLNWHGEKNNNIPEIVKRRSSIYGEQGFGIGVCGPWDI